MKIGPGEKILHYEVSSLIGKGGMGEVFRAKDSKLGRDVAIKVLPEEFTKDAERVARFEREARLLASLSHPHIASIYGVEDIDGVNFLVMELAAGENLSDRLLRGPIELDDAIEIALQIADALEAAHEKGIVHRDLKPANIKVDVDGRVQVLDFGLAKALETEESDDDFSNSPTMVRAATHQGMILGTAAYMSPEQAKGKRVDRRADIWAFGVVLWEMITGSRLFLGETVSDTLAAVLKEEPDWGLLPETTPANVRRLLRRCLTRNPKDRLRDIGDAKIELREESAADEGAEGSEIPAPGRWSAPWLLPLVLVAGLLSGIGLARFFVQSSESTQSPLRAQLSLTLPDDAPLAAGSFMPALAFSPDGESLAYVGIGKDGVRRIYVRQLDEDAARVLPGTEGAEGPFFSPDGEWIGFWSPWKVRKVRVSGAGVPEVVCDSVDFRGGTWAGQTIVFTPGQDTPLFRVPDSGGRPEALTRVEGSETGHRLPHTLPDGDTIVFSARQRQFDANRAKIATVSLSSGERKDVGSGSADVHASSTGHLLYVQAGKLIAVPFDLAKLEITGEATTVVEGVVVQLNTGAAQLAVSSKGHLAWVKGDLSGDAVTLARVDREGRRTSILETTKLHRHPALSPDDKRLAVMAIDPDVGGAWMMSTEGTEQRRLTSSPRIPIWSPDGRWVASQNDNSTEVGVVRIESIDGSTPGVDVVRIEQGNLTPSAMTAEGVLAYTLTKPDGDRDAWTVDTSKAGDPEPFLVGPDNDCGVVFSPDGRYAAYVSDRTGDFEVFVTTFPDKSATWQISTNGGSEVVWRRDGREIFFRAGQDLVAVPVDLDPSFHAGTPVVLFQGPYEGVLGNPGAPNFDAAVDGSWFLMSISSELGETAADLRVALNWAETSGRR